MSFFDDPVMRHREIQRIGKSSTGRRYIDKDKLDESPAPDPYVAPPEDTGVRMSHAVLDEAEKELAAKYGHGTVNDMIYLAHASADLGWSENERHIVLYEVERALRNRESQVPAHKVAGLRDDVLKLAASQGTGSGLDDSDRGEDEVALTGQTQESAAMALAAGSGQDSANSVIARHPELAHLFKTSPRTSSRRHPKKSGRMVGTKTRAHASDLDESTRDTRQPARGGAVHADVRRLIEGNPDLFSDGTGHEGEGTGNQIYRPTPYKSPGPSGRPQSR
jgi:hypothetical protein